MKVPGSLSAEMHAGDFRAVAFKAHCSSGKGDRLFDERTQFLGLRKRGDDAIVARIHERRGQIAQQRDAMFCCPPKFSMGLKMTHDPLSYSRRETRSRRVL